MSLSSLHTFLIEHKLNITTAESCTGGLLAATLTELPGSSAFFEMGFITYSNESKQLLLGVRAKTLEELGAVSIETAGEMVLGALTKSDADLAIAITGIAGPEGGSTDKPVGTVCFGIARRDGPVATYTEFFSGDRTSIREQAVGFAIAQLQKLLQKKSPR